MLCPSCSYDLGDIELIEGEIMFCHECGCNVPAVIESLDNGRINTITNT